MAIYPQLIKLLLNRQKPAKIGRNCDCETQDMLEHIKNARTEWLHACMDFEYVDDQDIIDYYTYKIKACQIRYEYFLKKAKLKGLQT